MISQSFESALHGPLTGHQNIVFFNLFDRGLAHRPLSQFLLGQKRKKNLPLLRA